MRSSPISVGRLRLGLPILLALVLSLVALGSSPIASATILPFQGPTAAMSADRTVAAPGDVVTFTIDISQIPEGTKTLTIDDSVPPGLRIGSTSEPDGCARTDATWSCNPRGVSALAIQVHMIVEESARGEVLVNRAVIDAGPPRSEDEEDEEEDEEEQDGKDEGEGEADGGEEDEEDGDEDRPVTVQASVRIVASDISVSLSASQSLARPGETLNFRLELVNDGVGPALNANVIAWLPSRFSLFSVHPKPTAIAQDWVTWSVGEIPVGSHAYLFNATFAAGTRDEYILASALVWYTDSNGDAPQHQDSVLRLPVAVDPPLDPAASEESPFGAIAGLLAASVTGLAMVQRFVLAPRSTRLRIDQLFLLHKSGLLMKHFAAPRLGAGDPDIQGAMITAVQSYLENSVDSAAGPLRQIMFGGHEIVFANGGSAILAAIVRKGDPAIFFDRAPRFLADLEVRVGPDFANWNGVIDGFDGLDGPFRDFTRELQGERAT